MGAAPMAGGPAGSLPALRAVRRPFASVDPETWDALAAASRWQTPFSRWAFHRAWWDAYGANAHDQTTVLVRADRPDDSPPVAIAPLMHRHEVEPDDAILRTQARHAAHRPLTAVPATAKAVFMGASYHADYATLLCAPGDVRAACEGLAAGLLASPAPGDADPVPWDVVDLRRIRAGDPFADEIVSAIERTGGASVSVTVEREDVCPVVQLEPGTDFDVFLATLGKKERHEIRRKLRRAEGVGEVRLEDSADPLGDLEAFIELHQKRWGADGLFPDTGGGAQSRVFFRRLLELGVPAGFVRLTFATVEGRRVAAGFTFEDASTAYFFNAGIDPEARDLSPGILLSALSIRDAIGAGRRRFDYLRGDESYKYEWGAADEEIRRVLVTRTS
jgi:CelD/BcsL family acetyltransferase involved in cellulose biosynthesis